MTRTILWTAYFDANRTRSEGRRIAQENALSNPTVEQIANAVQQVGYTAKIERNSTYPRDPTATGRVIVKTSGEDTKTDIIHAVAAYAPLV